MKVIHTINLLLIAALSLAPSYAPTAPKKELTTYEKIKTLKPRGSNKTAEQIGRSIDVHCDSPLRDLVLAIIFVESSFIPNAVSPTGDIGLSQLSPTMVWRERLTAGRILRDTDYAIRHTCRLLARRKRWTDWHSKTPSRAKAYKTKVKAAYAKIQGR